MPLTARIALAPTLLLLANCVEAPEVRPDARPSPNYSSEPSARQESGQDLLARIRREREARESTARTPKWKVECRVDDLHGTRSCQLRNGITETPFGVNITGTSEPWLSVGVPDFLGSVVTIRVDQNQPIETQPLAVEAMAETKVKTKLILEQLRTGQVVRFGWLQRRGLEQRATLSLVGYATAYEALLRANLETGSFERQIAEPPAAAGGVEVEVAAPRRPLKSP